MILLVDATVLLKAFVAESGQADAKKLVGWILALELPKK